eukprot:677921-Amphidinium_carterae.1
MEDGSERCCIVKFKPAHLTRNASHATDSQLGHQSTTSCVECTFNDDKAHDIHTSGSQSLTLSAPMKDSAVDRCSTSTCSP